MLIRFNQNVIKDEVFDYIQDNLFKQAVFYVIDSRYRKAVNLQYWIRRQVNSPSEEIRKIANSIPSYDSYDKQMEEVYRWVRLNIKYIGDWQKFKVMEMWEDAEVVAKDKNGDCESGASLIYILARLKGIPSNRLCIHAGEVEIHRTASTGGHAWVAYRPEQYPLNFVFMDWCYYANLKTINMRNKFSVINQEIQEYTRHGELVTSNYLNLWFAFNEDWSSRKIRLKV